MRLQELANWNVAGRGGYRNRPVFLTPNGTKVVRLGDGYYPVTRRDKVRMDRRFLGREDDCEIWSSRYGTVSRVRIGG